MTTIAEMARRVASVKREIVPELIKGQKEKIIGYNQEQLFERSENSLGERLREYNSVFYAIQKERMNPKPGFMRPDLYLTGAFYRGFSVTVEKDNFSIWSSDEKTEKLVTKYGATIFGLTDQSRSRLRSDFWIVFKLYIENQTGLRFK